MSEDRFDELMRKFLVGELSIWDLCNEFGCSTAFRDYINVLQNKYDDLIFQVENKYEGETRHDTAKRFIQMSQGSHDTSSEECWCAPEIELAGDGSKIIVHNEPH